MAGRGQAGGREGRKQSGGGHCPQGEEGLVGGEERT